MDNSILFSISTFIGLILLIPVIHDVCFILAKKITQKVVTKSTVEITVISGGVPSDFTIHMDDSDQLVKDLLKIKRTRCE